MSFLTSGDEDILPLALRKNGQFHVATDWYLRGWIPLPYEYAYHQITKSNVTWKAGIAVGKTITSAASCAMDCLTIPYFKCLNTSVTARQAELPFDFFMGWYEGNDRLEHLVEDIKLRPWPIIKFKNFSEWEFRTAGKDARFIRGTEYDRIVYDEPELDMDGETVKILRGRLRGTRPDGTQRLCRLDTNGTPSDALWWIDRFSKGNRKSDKYDPLYLSMLTTTYENTHLTREQVELMEAEYTEEDIQVELLANDPDYGASMFPKSHINACTSQELNDMAYIALNPEDGTPVKKGWVIEEHPRHGITKFEMPADPRGMYVMAGDPGLDDPPRRNAASVMVFDAITRPAKMVYMDWVSGHGSYMPFLNSYKYAINKYRPSIKMLDTTSTQKGIQELAFEQAGIETDSMNFSRDKEAALNALSLAVTSHDLLWPNIKGIVKQMSSYTRDSDKKSDFPQDLTMTLAMAAFGIRFLPEPEGETTKQPTRGRAVRTVTRRRR